MAELKPSKASGAKTARQDRPDVLLPTWEALKKAIQEGKTSEALKLMERCRELAQANNDSLVEFASSLMTTLAGTCGDDALEKALRIRGQYKAEAVVAGNPSPEESMRRGIYAQSRHLSNIVSVVEEPDRYVVTIDPCGSGGKLRRERKVSATKGAHPWTWGKSGVPYYCTHCSIQNEILPIELRGYPVRVTECGKTPGDPCVHLYYKRPELIPEEYFTRVGKTKTIK